MQYIEEKAKNIPVSGEYDVAVVGGGMAGIAAALAAARHGAKTVLIEKQFALGGLATLGLVTIYLPICDGCGRQVSFGIAEELLKLSVEHGFARRTPELWFKDATKEERAKGERYLVEYNPQLFAISAEKLLLKEGVKILYGTIAASVNMNGDKIDAVITENKSGRRAVKVKSVVDCTGDADVCVLSGAEVEYYEQKNVLAGWCYFVNENGLNLKPLGYADIPDEEKDGTEEKHLTDERFSGIDAEEITRFVQLGHEQIEKDVLKLNKEKGYTEPVTIPTIPQLRMTRMIKGLYPMSKADDRKEFDDCVGESSGTCISAFL